MNLKDKVKIVKEYRLIDDIFFEVFAKDIPACQEIIRTILEDDKLIVHDVIVQSSERNLYGRSVRLDALCTLGNGSKCNIEVQRSNNDNHLKRARFNELKSEGGASAVCEIMEKYLKEERIKAIQKLLQKGCTKDFITDLDYTEQEYQEAEASLSELN